MEKQLWRILRNRHFAGYKFRRQHIINRYIVDFVCLEKRLIIEVDGGQHQKQKQYDEDMDQYLKQQGYRIVRFWNNEVLENSEGVQQVILQHLRSPNPGA